MTTATVRYTSSREHTAAVSIARIAAAGRVRQARLDRERADAAQATYRAAMLDGQSYSDFGDWCYICHRATDHWGEHTPEQIDAWRASEGPGTGIFA